MQVERNCRLCRFLLAGVFAAGSAIGPCGCNNGSVPDAILVSSVTNRTILASDVIGLHAVMNGTTDTLVLVGASVPEIPPSFDLNPSRTFAMQERPKGIPLLQKDISVEVLSLSADTNQVNLSIVPFVSADGAPGVCVVQMEGSLVGGRHLWRTSRQSRLYSSRRGQIVACVINAKGELVEKLDNDWVLIVAVCNEKGAICWNTTDLSGYDVKPARKGFRLFVVSGPKDTEGFMLLQPVVKGFERK